MSSIDPDIERGGQVPWSIRVENEMPMILFILE